MSFPESADYVNQLDDQKPNGQDPISYGDNHIRLIKKAVHDSFPNVGGPVTATHEELSFVSGVTGPIQDQLDDGFQQIAGNDTDISNLEGRMDSAEARLDTAESRLDGHDAEFIEVRNLEIGDHPDVEFNGAPEDGDVLVYDNGKWTAKRVGGAGVTKMIAQPKVVGDFDGDGGSAENTWRVIKSSNGWVTFAVPAGLKFILQYINTSGDGRVYMSGSNGIKIDDVQPYADWYSNGLYIGQSGEGWPVGGKGSGPLIEVKNSIQLYVSSIGAGQDHQVRISGVFAEDK